jgi:dTDP-4-dehydrorhamnose 3,5-epimerase
MGTVSLNDILITPLARIPTAGGDVLHAMKKDDRGCVGFGEAYLSLVTAEAVKAWKRHTRMTMNVLVPEGRVKFVFWLDTDDKYRVEEIGADRYVRLTVPPGIWFGFQGLASPHSLVLNIASIPHDPNEVERRAPLEINFDWN